MLFASLWVSEKPNCRFLQSKSALPLPTFRASLLRFGMEYPKMRLAFFQMRLTVGMNVPCFSEYVRRIWEKARRISIFDRKIRFSEESYHPNNPIFERRSPLFCKLYIPHRSQYQSLTPLNSLKTRVFAIKILFGQKYAILEAPIYNLTKCQKGRCIVLLLFIVLLLNLSGEDKKTEAVSKMPPFNSSSADDADKL